VDGLAIKKLRTERRQAFGMYLKNLVRDFNRLHWAAHTVLLASEADNPALADRLVRTRVQFQRTVMRVRVHLLLDTIGVGGVDASRIVEALELVNSDFHSLAAAHARSAHA